MIKAIFMDVDDTLLNWNGSAYHSMCLTAQEMGVELPEDILEHFHKINENLWHRIEEGTFTIQQLRTTRFNLVFQSMGIEAIDGVRFEEGFVRNLHFSYVKNEYAQEIMDYLSKKYPVYIATNASTLQQTHRLEGAGLYSYISDMFVSEQAGFSKPKKEYFDYCFSKLPQYQPEDIIMIGDSLNADIFGAHQYGLKTIWYNPRSEERSELADYTIHSLKEIETIL